MEKDEKDQKENGAAPEIDPNALLKNIEGMFQRFVGGAEAKAAATTQIEVKDNTPPIESKVIGTEEDKGETHADRTAKFVDPLRKSFERLAQIHPGYRRLGSNAAMDDPYGYLSAKGADGRHIITDYQLDAMAQFLLKAGNKEDAMPLSDWFTKGQGGNLLQHKMEQGLMGKAFGEMTGVVSKALDTFTSNQGGALIRTDLEPILYEAYLRRFPAGASIRTFPANGLVHTYDIRSAIGSAALVGELGDIVAQSADATSTIERKANSNIAILCSRRGISLKLQFAVAQSGMAFPLSGNDNLEVIGGITAIANLNQTLLFQGNFADAAGTTNNEDGVYNVLGYTGLRNILKGAGTSKTFVAGETHRRNLDALASQIDDDGGTINNLLVMLRHGARIAIQDELEDFVRISQDKSRETGIRRDNLMGGLMLFGGGLQRFLPVPGQVQTSGIGYYDISSVAYEDIYLSDPDGIGFAYLGSPAPVILNLPVGFDNKLGDVYILFMMNGLVVTIPKFHRKYRIPKQTY